MRERRIYPSADTRHAVPFLGRISDTGMKLAYQLSEAGCSFGEPDLAHLAEISNRAKVRRRTRHTQKQVLSTTVANRYGHIHEELCTCRHVTTSPKQRRLWCLLGLTDT